MAQRVIINGSLSAIDKPLEMDFDPVRGVIVHKETVSAGDNLAGLANSLFASNIAFKWKKSPVLSSIHHTASGGIGGIPDQPQISWQLMANEIQKSVFESTFALNGLVSYPSLVADVRGAYDAITNGDEATADGIRTNLPFGEVGYFDTLLGFLVRGQTHFAAGQYALRLTYCISNFYAGYLLPENAAEHLFTTAYFLSQPNFPPAMTTKIISIGFPPQIHPGYAWGWRMLPATMTWSASNRMDVSNEFWFGEWSTVLYPFA